MNKKHQRIENIEPNFYSFFFNSSISTIFSSSAHNNDAIIVVGIATTQLPEPIKHAHTLTATHYVQTKKIQRSLSWADKRSNSGKQAIEKRGKFTTKNMQRLNKRKNSVPDVWRNSVRQSGWQISKSSRRLQEKGKF